MILAAGYGRRLRPLTDKTPKALIEVGGQTMLERIVRWLTHHGADRVVVNVHHHADLIEKFLRQLQCSKDLDATFLISREQERPLETGGGVLAAAHLFRPGLPIVVHNVDVITDLDLGAMLASHRESGALATLAVSDRPSKRRLCFDDVGLFGRVNADGAPEIVREPSGATRTAAFSGTHLLSAMLPGRIAESETGSFPIIDAYLRLAAAGERIRPHDATGSQWLEIGTPKRLQAARQALGSSNGSGQAGQD